MITQSVQKCKWFFEKNTKSDNFFFSEAERVNCKLLNFGRKGLFRRCFIHLKLLSVTLAKLIHIVNPVGLIIEHDKLSVLKERTVDNALN